MTKWAASLFALSSLCLLAGCRDSGSARELATTDSLYVTAPVVSVNDAPGDGSKSFTDIRSAAFLDDTTFVVADARGRVVIAHIDGRIEREVGQAGAGPGEFRVPMLVTASENGFAMWDATLRRMSWFDGAGEFQRAQSLPHAQSTMPVAPHGTAFLTVRESGQLADTAKAQAALMRIGADPAIGDTLLGPFAVPEFGWEVRDERSGTGRMINPPVFAVAPSWRLHGDSIVVWVDAETGRIVVVDPKSGTVRREGRLLRASRSVSSVDRDSFFAAYARRFGIDPISDEVRATVPITTTFPVAARLLVDGCEIWAGDVDPAGRAETGWLGRHWEVRDVCRGRSRVVVVPVGVELLDVRGKWMVGVAEDELGGQQLQLFANAR